MTDEPKAGEIQADIKNRRGRSPPRRCIGTIYLEEAGDTKTAVYVPVGMNGRKMKKDRAKKGTEPIEHTAVPARRAPHVKMSTICKNKMIGLYATSSLHEEKPAMGVGYFHILIERIGSMCIAHCLECGFVAAAPTAGQALEEMRQAIITHNEYLRENPDAVTYKSSDSIFERFAQIAGWTGNPRAAVLQHTANGLFGLRFQLSRRDRKWIEEGEVREIIHARLINYDPKKSITVEELRNKWGL